MATRPGSNLTDIRIRTAEPREKKYKLSGGRGLTLIVMPDGAKYWRIRYRYAGREKELSLGRPYPELSLKEANQELDRMRMVLASGIDPAKQREQAKLTRREAVANTFGDAAEAWFQFRQQVWAERTREQIRTYLDKDLLPELGKRPLSAITTRELAIFMKAIVERGAPDIAKKARQWLASIFSFARGNGWVTTDPVRDLSRRARSRPTSAAAWCAITPTSIDACRR